MRRVELRIVGVLADPDVVPDRGQLRVVELDAGVHAVVGRAVGRQAPGVVGVGLVQGEAGRGGLRRPGSGVTLLNAVPATDQVVPPSADLSTKAEAQQNPCLGLKFVIVV